MKKIERKSMSGIFKRKGIWRIDKTIYGKRIQESCKTSDLAEAEKCLVHRTEEIRQAQIYGTRPKRIFREAVIKYLTENQHKRRIRDEAWVLRTLDAFIGDLPLEAVHIGSLQAYIEQRRRDGVKTRTINYGLQIVRHMLNLAASVWLDEYGLTWVAHAPKIKLLDERVDKRPSYPLSWEEQDRLFAELPEYLKQMALFAVNSGCRDREICQLRWEWEVAIPELNISVFIIPGNWVKNGDDRLVVLNENATAVIEAVRGQDPVYVFTYKRKPLYRMLSRAWKKARVRIGLPHLRVHDLKHTFGRRLRAAGVSHENRQDLLGHRTNQITTHYSAGEISDLLAAANMVCRSQHSTPTLVVLKRQASSSRFSGALPSNGHGAA